MENESALDELAAKTQTATSVTRRVADEARMAEIRKLQAETLEAIQSKDKESLNLLNKRLGELIREENAEKKAFVDTLKGLRDAGKALGVEIAVAEEVTPAEKTALNSAENAAKVAEAAYTAILNDPPFFFPESRTEKAKKAVDSAKAQLERVETDNARAASARLEKIDIEEASQRLIRISENAQESAQNRRTTIATEVENARAEITRIQGLDQQLAKDLDKLKNAVDQADQARSDAQVDLDRMTPGTEEYSVQQKVLQQREDAHKKATNERDATMEVRNQVQLNLEYTETHLSGQRDIETGLMVFQKIMEEQLSGLVVQYKSRVEAARALADLKFSSDVHKTGNAVMEGMAEYMAKAGSAASQEVATMAEEQPEAIRRARATRKEQDQAAAATQTRIDAVFADMERNYQSDQNAA